MQRRAAAAYLLLFLVLGASAYSVLATAQQPPIDVKGQTYSQGDSFQVNGQQYTVKELTSKTTSGEGGSTTILQGTLAWTNESAVATATLNNGSSTTYQGGNYTIAIPNQSDASSFTLQPTNNTTGGPRTFSTGDQYEYDAEGVTATVSSVSAGQATLEWTSPKENTFGISEGQNVTLNGQPYVIHFMSESSVQVSPEIQAYHSAVRRQEYFAERENGLKGVVILSAIASVILIGLAYLPHRG
ncbi:MAG: hypothetical protein ABEJ23_00890 [Haloarculaceae archaeon]